MIGGLGMIPVLRLIRLLSEARNLLGIVVMTSTHIDMVRERMESVEAAIPVISKL
jgi:hypothetical protein